MKLLLTLDFPPERGGVQRYLYSIVKHVYSEDDWVIIARPRRRQSCFCDLRPRIRGVDFPGSRLMPKLSLISGVGALIPWWFSPFADVTVEAGNVYAALCPWLLSLLWRRAYRVYAYGSELLPLTRRTLRARLLRSALQKAEIVYVLGDYTASLLRAAGVRTPVATVPPRVETTADALRRTIDQRLSARANMDDAVRILTVGRLVPHKGHHVLIDACALLGSRRAWTCVIVGDGPCRPVLARQAAPLADRIILPGELSDAELAEEYSRATVFVLPSLETPAGVEGFGLVLLEAMQAGLPIIASRSGGVADVVGDAAILTPAGDARALAAAIERCADNAPLRAKLIIRAADRLLKHFAW